MKPILYHKDFFNGYKAIKEHSVDLVLTDPPYGIYWKETNLHTGLEWDVMPDVERMETVFDKLLTPTGQIVMFADLNLLLALLSGFTNHFLFRFYLIWKKSGGMPISKFRPLPDTELILVFRRKNMIEANLTWNWKALGKNGQPYRKKNYNKNIPIRKGKKLDYNQNDDGWRYPKTIIEAPNKPNFEKNERTLHPTQKPEILVRKLIKCFSNKGDTVLDPFTGSGTTLVCSHLESRKSIGFEINKRYYTEALNRIKNHTAQETLF